MKFMAINAVTDLKGYLFCLKKRIKRSYLKMIYPASNPPSLAKTTLAA